jgi:hypothetical protein
VNSQLDRLAARREALVVRSDQERAALMATFGGIERRFALAETVVAAARRLSRHRILVGAAGVVMLVAPFAFRSWIRRVMWLAPLAVEGYRTVRAHADARRGSPVRTKTDRETP